MASYRWFTLSTTPLAGVLITAQPGGATATTNAMGNYTISGLANGTTYTITPTMTGKVFDPASRTVTSTGNVTIHEGGGARGDGRQNGLEPGEVYPLTGCLEPGGRG